MLEYHEVDMCVVHDGVIKDISISLECNAGDDFVAQAIAEARAKGYVVSSVTNIDFDPAKEIIR